MRLTSFFSRSSTTKQPEPTSRSMLVELADLDHSFSMLKETTTAVSAAAAEAAKTLNYRLNESLHRFMSTIDAVQDVVLIKDGEGKWCTLNKFGQQILAMHHGEYYQKTDGEIAEMFPHLRLMLEQCSISDTMAWDKRETHRTEEKVPQLNGAYVYLDVMKTPVFTPEGSRKELLIIGRDITELINKQSRTRACFTALNSASDAIVIIDNNQKVYFSNDKFLEMFGIDDYHEANNKKLSEVMPGIPRYDEMWDTVQQNKIWSIQCPDADLDKSRGTTMCESDTTACNTDDCPLHGMQLDVIPMMNGHPKPIYYICTLKKRAVV